VVNEVAGVAGLHRGCACEHRVRHRPREAVGAAPPFLPRPNQITDTAEVSAGYLKIEAASEAELTSSMGRIFTGLFR
jgi:hypothetical protein